MQYSFQFAQDHLRAELYGRETAEETARFLDALTAEARKHKAQRILVWVRNSRPIFKVGEYNFSEKLKALGGARIALLADSDEVRASHQYIEVLATQQGAQVRAFRDEARALRWLKAQSQE